MTVDVEVEADAIGDDGGAVVSSAGPIDNRVDVPSRSTSFSWLVVRGVLLHGHDPVTGKFTLTSEVRRPAVSPPSGTCVANEFPDPSNRHAGATAPRCEDRPGNDETPEHMHITLAYLAGVDVHRLADAAALTSNEAWPATQIALTGDIRHGSWELRKNPDYRHDPDTVQAGEQVRLGVEHNAELTAIRSRLRRQLGIPESRYWPHITLGVARQSIPAASLIPMPLPEGAAAAASLELQQEITTTHFRVLARAALDAGPADIP